MPFTRSIRLVAALSVSVSLAANVSAQFPLRVPVGKDPFGAAAEKMQEGLFVKSAAKLLNDQLPINLDATKTLPKVSALPGAPFSPQPLQLTTANLNQPLAPGDYVIDVMAFCTQYSVHRPGQGVAYELAPLEGRLATPIATLLWRGVQRGVPAQHLMSVAWTVQSGLTYQQMPKATQVTIDSLIPEYRMQLSGDFLTNLELSYGVVAKAAKLPPLDQLLVKMGDAGKAVLEAEVMRRALLANAASDEVREQTLFAGQESGLYAPVKAEDGPWEVRIPGVAYMRYVIHGGNLNSNNVIEIRIAGNAANQVQGQRPARLLNASYAPSDASSAPSAPTPLALMGAQQNPDGNVVYPGMIGYSEGQGAQALIPVPVIGAPVPNPPQQCTITSIADATEPSDRARTRLGVGETVHLSVSSGSATWSVVQGEGTITPDGVFTAPLASNPPGLSGPNVVQAVTASGKCTKGFTIVEPSELLFYALPNLGYTLIRRPTGQGTAVAARPAIFLGPGDVSFKNIEIAEFEGANKYFDWKEVTPTRVSSHLVQTPNGPAWFFSCDYLLQGAVHDTTSTSVFEFTGLTNQPSALDGALWKPFSEVETEYSSTSSDYLISKGQIASFPPAPPQSGPLPAASFTIPADGPQQVVKDPGNIESCYTNWVVPQLKFPEIH